LGHDVGGELYHPQLVGLLERIWGDGWLSPGGPQEVARILEGVSLKGLSVLDIGCGAGGIDIELVRVHGAAYVSGIDVEETVVSAARARAAAAGLGDRIGIAKVAPGPLPFPPRAFGAVFSKDSIVHIPDKHALMREAFRVLRPGGWFLASDWLIGVNGEPSQAMKDYLAAEGLDFGMASPASYEDAMRQAGFISIQTTSRNTWYRAAARKELEVMKGPLFAEAALSFGKGFVEKNIAIWERMIAVLDTGEHCPAHLRAMKPYA
jgi:SAM-dependent methyltransferase